MTWLKPVSSLWKNSTIMDIGEFINVGAEKDIKIKDLAQLIKETVGYDGTIRHDLSKPDGIPKKLLDSSRIKLLGWEPRTSLREGIKRTVEWYRSIGRHSE